MVKNQQKRGRHPAAGAHTKLGVVRGLRQPSRANCPPSNLDRPPIIHLPAPNRGTFRRSTGQIVQSGQWTDICAHALAGRLPEQSHFHVVGHRVWRWMPFRVKCFLQWHLNELVGAQPQSE
jgi:hypothetical protein